MLLSDSYVKVTVFTVSGLLSSHTLAFRFRHFIHTALGFRLLITILDNT